MYVGFLPFFYSFEVISSDFGVFWFAYVESKWCHFIMVEADSHLKLLSTSILDICKVFEHIDMLSIGIQSLPYKVIPTLIGSGFGTRGPCGVKMLWSCHVWGWQPPQTASHIHIRHIHSVWAHWYAVHWHTVWYPHIPTLIGSDFGVLGYLSSQHDVIMSWLRQTAASNCFLHP